VADQFPGIVEKMKQIFKEEYKNKEYFKVK